MSEDMSKRKEKMWTILPKQEKKQKKQNGSNAN